MSRVSAHTDVVGPALVGRTASAPGVVDDLAIAASTMNVVLGIVASLPSYANDAAAQAGGVPVGGLYRNASAVQIRVS